MVKEGTNLNKLVRNRSTGSRSIAAHLDFGVLLLELIFQHLVVLYEAFKFLAERDFHLRKASAKEAMRDGG